MTTLSSLETAFLCRWEQLTRGLSVPAPTTQVLFHRERDWRFDFGWVEGMVLLDLQGGGFVRGAHHRESGMVNDFHKHNAALLLGWRPVLATTSMIADDPQSVIDLIVALLGTTASQPRSQWTARIRNLRVGDCVQAEGVSVERPKPLTFFVSGQTVDGRKRPLKTVQRDVVDMVVRGRAA